MNWNLAHWMTRALLKDQLNQKLTLAGGRNTTFRQQQTSVGGSTKERASERVPGRLRGELQIADIGPEPQANAGANGHQHHAVPRKGGGAEAANEIGGAGNADKALKDRIDAGHVVDQDHSARAVAAEVEAERRALPIDLQVAGITRIEGAFAITKPDRDRARRFLAQNVTVWLTPLAEGLFHHER